MLVREENPADAPDVSPAQNTDGTVVIWSARFSALLEAHAQRDNFVQFSQACCGPVPAEASAAIKNCRIMALKLQGLARLERRLHDISVLAALNFLPPFQQVMEILFGTPGIDIARDPEHDRRPLAFPRNQKQYGGLKASV